MTSSHLCMFVFGLIVGALFYRQARRYFALRLWDSVRVISLGACDDPSCNRLHVMYVHDSLRIKSDGELHFTVEANPSVMRAIRGLALQSAWGEVRVVPHLVHPDISKDDAAG
jgi:hypothetical protein